MHRLLMLVSAALVLTGCVGVPAPTPTPASDLVDTMVAATLSALPSVTPAAPTSTTVPTPGVSASPTAGTGQVGGKVCYPSGASAMTAYLEQTASHQVTESHLSDRQPSYQVDLQPGTYIAYAWLDDFSQGGSYSKCGTDDTCKDATPLPFTVAAGEKLENIDLCDWSHGPFDIPYPPGHPVQSTTGIISGSIRNYPEGDLPVLNVVAYNQGNGYWYWVGTAAGQNSYSITDLLPGSYQVVAYDSHGHAGGSPVVTVTAGQTTAANVSDWSGSYPDNPVH